MGKSLSGVVLETGMGNVLGTGLGTVLLGCALAVASVGGALAQGRPIYPWCAFYNAAGGMVECLYYDVVQCRASVSGVGGFCYRNLEYLEPPALLRKPRAKRKHHA